MATDQMAADELAAEHRGETPAQRRRRLDAIFGEVLPETTRDERSPGSPRGDGGSAGDRWLREQVPPHHGS